MSLAWLPNVRPLKEMTKWNVSKVDSNQICYKKKDAWIGEKTKKNLTI
jgi:hypothetical protein